MSMWGSPPWLPSASPRAHRQLRTLEGNRRRPDGLRLRRIRMDHARERRQADVRDHRQRDLVDHLAGVTRDDRRTEDPVAVIVHVDLDEAALLAVGDRAID